MKHFLSLLLILTFSFQAFSQKKTVKKTKSKPKTTIVKEEAIAEEVSIQAEKIIPDTLHIQKGKKYVFIVNTSEYSTSDTTEDYYSEQAELKRNFPKENLEIININKYTHVIFENLQTLDITGDGQSFQAFAYWSGKMNDKVQVKEGTRMATEFVSEHVGGKKESSYVVNTRKYKKELALLQKNKTIPKSKELMKAVLGTLTLPVPETEADNLQLFQQGNAKLKTLNAYILQKKGVQVPLKSINFNSEGLPTSISSYNEGKVNNKRTFIYNDGILTNIIDGENHMINITYSDNKMILSQNVGEANATHIFWLENSKVLEKRYILMIDDKFSYMNSFSEEKFENNCITHYINNSVWTKNCSGASNTFPFIHTYTSFQNKEVLQFRKSKLEKKDERTFEKYYSESKSADQNDTYKLWGTFHLDESNLIDTINFTEDNMEQTIKIDYICYE
nr:hypothetical protein [uncultured Flavobacterium sp.]